MGKKESRIVAYLEHSPIRVGDKIVLETIGKKPPRITIEKVATKVEELATRVDGIAMTVEKLAQIVYDGFKKIDERFAKQEKFNAYVMKVFQINKLILPD